MTTQNIRNRLALLTKVFTDAANLYDQVLKSVKDDTKLMLDFYQIRIPMVEENSGGGFKLSRPINAPGIYLAALFSKEDQSQLVWQTAVELNARISQIGFHLDLDKHGSFVFRESGTGELILPLGYKNFDLGRSSVGYINLMERVILIDKGTLLQMYEGYQIDSEMHSDDVDRVRRNESGRTAICQIGKNHQKLGDALALYGFRLLVREPSPGLLNQDWPTA